MAKNKYCPECRTLLLYLYYRNNQKDGSRRWKKTGNKYCKKCNKVY